ncbi:hypothetical protein GOP47_0028168 [Adiantum capillus-veneris]|nr:hypothetical protein GOP47_0028168 [Adiantum capillus-veneris]
MRLPHSQVPSLLPPSRSLVSQICFLYTPKSPAHRSSTISGAGAICQADSSMHEKEIRQNLEATVAGSQQTGGMEYEKYTMQIAVFLYADVYEGILHSCCSLPCREKSRGGSFCYEKSASISSEIMWVGGYWTSGKHLKHYDSFLINGITIPVRSFCYIMIEQTERLVAYILDLYEDKKSQKKMKVRWLHKSKEIKSPIPPPQPLQNELFMTRYTQVLRLECCDGVVYVLTPNHFEVSMPNITTSGEHVYACGRHFGNEGFKPYDLSTMKGYWSQKIFSSGLIPPYLSDIARANTEFHEDEQAGSGDFYEDEQAGSGQVIKSGTKAPRSARRRATGRYDLLNEEGDWTPQQESCRSSYDAANAVTSSGVNLLKVFHDTDSRGVSAALGQDDLVKVGNKVEVLCNDSGMRGCWFRCTVLETRSSIKIRYDDVLEVGSNKKLEERVPVNSIAPADKPGFRISGRKMMRPLPSEVEMVSTHEPGSAVDVWGGEGWWEGIMVGRNASGQVKVAFPAEEYTAWFEESKVRISREWFDGQWLAVQPNANTIDKNLGLHSNSQEKDRNSSPEFQRGWEAASQSPLPGVEDRKGMLPDRGFKQLVAASFPANKYSACPIEGLSTDQALENPPEKGKCLSSLHKAATHQTVTQSPILSYCKGSTNLPNHCNKYLGKVAEATPFGLEDLNSKCIAPKSCRNISEDSSSSQPAKLQQLDLNRDKENNTHSIDMTSEGLRLLSRKRHLDVDDSMFARPSKSVLFPSRDPSADLLVNQSQEQEDGNVGVFTFDKLTEIGNVEVKRSQYGFEQVTSSTGAPGAGPLFNSVSVQNLVLSR